ncbi:MAG TPA: glycosyltransferase family 2 protein [Longimicrobium sp.]|nr:glycosyltransferase family 2 protein [Longimicrobium sp.]
MPFPQRSPDPAPFAAPRAAADVRVAVCVCTYQRPAMLAALLDSLARQSFAGPAPRVTVIVVDNDADASAREVVGAARDALPFPLRYEVEPERNIALARNRAVRAALEEGTDFAAFIDDDEAARPDWLRALLEAQARYGADVVAGPVRPLYPAEAPAWLVRGGFWDAPREDTGALLPTASTNNALVTRRLLEEPGGPFDPAFGIGGSSDSLFFLRARRRGATLVWTADAVVEETVPASRARAGWVLRRAFRYGNAAVLCERALDPGLRRVGTRVAKAAGRFGIAAVLLAPSALLGRRGLLTALRSLSYGAGALAALLGYRYLEYRETHGG